MEQKLIDGQYRWIPSPRKVAALSKAAARLIGKLPGTDAEQLVGFMAEAGFKYTLARLMVGFHGDTRTAKKDLSDLAEAADALLNAAQSLSSGAEEILARAVTPYKTSRQFQNEISLALDGEGIDPLGQDPMGDKWIQGLYALREEAKAAVSLLGQMTAKKGRTPLGARLEGAPEDELARVCKEFTAAHGCKTQAVAVEMVQAILEAELGKDAMHRLDGTPKKGKGRKAVRKLA
jgi:hypothetical protein